MISTLIVASLAWLAVADESSLCPKWAAEGQCLKNKGFMLEKCKHSCADHLRRERSSSALPGAARPAIQHALYPEVKLQTDGIGGHVVRGVWLFGLARLLGLKMVCTPEMLFNGHMVRVRSSSTLAARAPI